MLKKTKNLVGVTVCQRHQQDLPRTCDNRPRDSAARHQVWTQGLTAINLSKISSENIRKFVTASRKLTMAMENGVLMTTDDSMKWKEDFRTPLERLSSAVDLLCQSGESTQNDDRVPDSHFESHSQAIAQDTACTTGGNCETMKDGLMVQVGVGRLEYIRLQIGQCCSILFHTSWSIWIESHPTTWKSTSKSSLECLVSWATIAWRFEDLAWRDHHRKMPSLLMQI